MTRFPILTDRLTGDQAHAGCPNPYCDGTGWVRCDATATNRAYCAPACRVGPHAVVPRAGAAALDAVRRARA